MPGVSREDILGRVRAAFRRGKVVGPDRVDHSSARIVADGDLLGRFTQMASDAGMQVHQAADARQAARIVADVVRQAGARRVLIEPGTFVARGPIVEALAGGDLELVDEPSDDEVLFSADVGITGVCGAIAETGSLVLRAGPETPRMTSLTPPVHVALLACGQIVPDLLDWPALHAPGRGLAGAYEVLITGPSKTADIELNLVTGVHGPGQVHVVVVRDR
ncbi:MAG TPA: lactate utilization protein [Phycisphaerae bacterium]|nr:lactate utilization protein [Phycisphaerae bacterium]